MCLIPFPNWTIYSASKIFIHNFSQSLSLELVMRTLIPCGVKTQLTKNLSMNERFFPESNKFVHFAIKKLTNTEVTSGYIWHIIIFHIFLILRFILTILGIDVLSYGF